MRICDITQKRSQYGRQVSFSQRKTQKIRKPNLQNITVVVDGRKIKLKVSTQAIRTLRKKGIIETATAA